jgi:hypothetical protein
MCSYLEDGRDVVIVDSIQLAQSICALRDDSN